MLLYGWDNDLTGSPRTWLLMLTILQSLNPTCLIVLPSWDHQLVE
jgi:hypothetical protein